MKAKRDERAEHQAADRRYIENFANWNRWPICPIKRSIGNNPHAAYLFIDHETASALDQGRVRIRHGNIFDMKENDPIEELTWEEFFNQGWMVD